MIEFKTVTEGQVLTLKILGRIDNEGIQTFQDKLSEIAGLEFKTLFLDLSGLEFINSSGIGKLLLFIKKAKNLGKETEIKGISNDIFTLFKAIRLDKIIAIEK